MGTPRGRAVGDDAEGERGVPARRIGQSRRRRAERAQSRRRQDNGVAVLEGLGESRRLVLACPVGGLEPGREDASGGAVERLSTDNAARLVMQCQRGARECRQQQHAEQRARPACMFAYARHPKMNPISLAPSPSSQAAVIWAAVTGEVRATALIVIEITPARARLRPA